MSFKDLNPNAEICDVTATLEALGERRSPPSAAVVTSDGATWSWPDLFAQFGPAIHSFARSRGSSSPEDIVQDVFAIAVERFPEFSGDTSGLRSFLFTLAYRRVADDHRSRYRRQEYLVADHEPTAGASVGVDELIIDVESASEAMKALQILGERERRVIEMRIIDEASPAEVAHAMGLSNGNVRVIQARALMKVRKYLEARSGDLPSFGLVLTLLKGLRSELPSHGGVAEWIEMLQSAAMRSITKSAAAGSGSIIAGGAASTVPVGAIAGSVLKVGLVVALATAAAVDVEVNVERTAAPSPHATGADAVVPVVDNTEQVISPKPSAVVEEPFIKPPPVAGNQPGEDAPSEPRRVPSAADVDEAPTGPGTLTDPLSNPDAGGEGSSVGGALEPVVKGVVDPTVETVESVVEDVADTVDTVVDEVVQPVVDVVGDTVDPVGDTVGDVEEVVVDTTGTVESVVDEITIGLDGLIRR